MTNHDHAEDSFANKPSRRRVVSTVAWTAPVIATAGLAPFAAASAQNTLLVQWASIFDEPLVQANIGLFDTSVDVSLLRRTWPRAIRFTNNGTTAFTGELTAQVSIAFASGIAATISFGDYVGLTVNSVTSPSGTPNASIAQRTTTANGSNPATTNTFINFGNHTISAGSSIDFAVDYRLAENALLTLNALSSYSATVTAYQGTHTARGELIGSDNSTIRTLVLAGLLV